MKTAKSPAIPSAAELYDYLMSQIEPELVKKQIPLLKKKYAGETAEARKVRMTRYKVAFKEYREALKKYMTKLNKEIYAYGKTLMKEAEKNTQSTEQNKLSILESLFSS